MSGNDIVNDIVFDTNTLINFFNGHASLQHYTASSVTLSIISVIEFLSYPKITEADELLLYNFLKKVKVINLELNNTPFIQQIAALRKAYKVKLPDAVIAATALMKNATLVTKDDDFRKIISLKISTY